MAITLYEEPQNAPWMFEYVTDNMSLIFFEEKLANQRHTPKNLAKWSIQALCNQNDLEFNFTKKIVPANSLLPTQEKLNAAKCIIDQVTNKWNALEKAFNSTTLNSIDGPHPILTFAGKYIIDGHHRWSQYMLSNPNALIEIIVIPPKRPTEIIPRIKTYFMDFNHTLDMFLAVNGLSEVLSVQASAERAAYKDKFKINLHQTKEILHNNITEFCVNMLYEQKQIHSKNVNEAVDFYIKNIQYILPLC